MDPEFVRRFEPILIAWLGSGDGSKIAVITAAVFYPTFINSLYGAKGVNKLYVWSARNMGAGPLRVFAKVILPAALPQVSAWQPFQFLRLRDA